MPTNYSATEAPANRDDLSLSLPVDGDPRSVSAPNTIWQTMANRLQRVWKKAGFLDLASTWTARQALNGGIEVRNGAAIYGDSTVSGSLTCGGGVAIPQDTSYSFVTPQTRTTFVSVYDFVGRNTGDDGYISDINGEFYIGAPLSDNASAYRYADVRVPDGTIITAAQVLVNSSFFVSGYPNVNAQVKISREVTATGGYFSTQIASTSIAFTSAQRRAWMQCPVVAQGIVINQGQSLRVGYAIERAGPMLGGILLTFTINAIRPAV